jgi:hypothetical protein
LVIGPQLRTNPSDWQDVTPFPALHTSANEHADEHLAAARKLAEDAESWLAQLDAVLAEDKPRS